MLISDTKQLMIMIIIVKSNYAYPRRLTSLSVQVARAMT